MIEHPHPPGLGAAPSATIYADDREEAGGVIARLRAMPGVRVEVKRLACGDYLIGERFLVERKRPDDLVQSLREGRFVHQLVRLQQGPAQALLLLEGSLDCVAGTGVNLLEVRRRILEMIVLQNVTAIWSHGPEDSAAWLASLAGLAAPDQMLQRDSACNFSPSPRPGNQRPVQSRFFRADTPHEASLKLLASAPGMGPRRAAALLERFGTIGALRQAGEDEIAAVPGIGQRLARGVHRLLE